MAAAIAPILTGLSGLAGLLGGGQQSSTSTSGTQNTTGTTSQNGQTSSSSTPNLTAIQQALLNQFSGSAEQMANSETNLNPYTASGLQTINQQGNANQQNISNTLAAKGLQYSPAAGNAYTQNAINQGNQQSSFLNTIPLLQRQIQQQNISQLEGAFSAQPTATSSTGTTSQTGTTGSNTQSQGTSATSGNPAAGLVSGLGSGLAASYPSLLSSFNVGTPGVVGGSVNIGSLPSTVNLDSYLSPTQTAPSVGGF
jgi:hypothetical protein